MSERIRIEQPGGYTHLPNELIWDTRLSCKAKGVMLMMFSVHPGWDYSVAGMAKACGMGKDAMRSALKEMEDAGYLERRQMHSPDGTFAGSEYVIRDHSEPLTENPTTAPLADYPSSGNPSSENPTQPLKTKINNTPYSPPAGDGAPKPSKRKQREAKEAPDWKPERFAGFWSMYPRGENKQGAMRAWDKLQPSDELIDTMARALKRQVASEDWRQGIGIPYASTYLNQQRWTDVLKPLAPASASRPSAAPRRVVETTEVQEW